MSTDRTSLPTVSWSGNAFSVHVRDTGSLGLIEFGSVDDVPDELASSASRFGLTPLSSLEFYWRPDGTGVICRVALSRTDTGSFDDVLLDTQPVAEYAYGLSERELEVLTLLVTGVSNATIATELWISERTVASHVNRVLQKLGFTSRTAAASLALDRQQLATGIRVPQVVQHHGCGPERADRVGKIPARDIWSRPVNGLEHRRDIPLRVEVPGRRDADRLSDCGREVGENVPEEVGRDDHFVVLRSKHELRSQRRAPT